jgi:hypothetical protein
MKFLALALLLLPLAAHADMEDTVNGCLAVWKHAPFKKGAEPDRVIKTGVKVLGIGKRDSDDLEATSKPKLVVIKPAVNVLGTTRFHLMNPNGWYCFRANVSVLGKISIEAHCKAHLAQSGDGGASVLGSDETDGSVAVLGSVRVTRTGCHHEDDEKSED